MGLKSAETMPVCIIFQIKIRPIMGLKLGFDNSA